MDKEIFIAFATQKGGIGKTTLTVLTASYLHYVKGYNVAVVDCDAPQNSIADLRAREIKVINESTYFKALACDHFRRVKKKAYPVVTISSSAIKSYPVRMLGKQRVVHIDRAHLMHESVLKPQHYLYAALMTLMSRGSSR